MLGSCLISFWFCFVFFFCLNFIYEGLEILYIVLEFLTHFHKKHIFYMHNLLRGMEKVAPLKITVVLIMGLTLLTPISVQGFNPPVPHFLPYTSSDGIFGFAKRVKKYVKLQFCLEKGTVSCSYKYGDDIEKLNECLYPKAKACYAKSMNFLFTCLDRCTEMMTGFVFGMNFLYLYLSNYIYIYIYFLCI